MNVNKEVAKLLQKALDLLTGGEGEGDESAESKPSFPTLKALKAMDDEGLGEVAEQFGIEAKKPKSTLLTIAKILEDQEVDDDAVEAVCDVVGIEFDSDDVDAAKTAIGEFVGAEGESSSEDEAGESNEDENDPPKKRRTAASDEDSGEDSSDDDDEKPARGKKGKKDDSEDEGGGSDDDQDVVDEIVEHLDEYNEVAPKSLKCKTGKQLVERCRNGEGELVPWGQAYLNGEEGMCCGLPLEDSGNDIGECAVTGSKWKFDEKSESFKPVKAKK